jgi:hypothetical protein
VGSARHVRNRLADYAAAGVSTVSVIPLAGDLEARTADLRVIA